MSAPLSRASGSIAACSSSCSPVGPSITLKSTRSGNFSKWYREVLKVADLAEKSCVPGCMVVKPLGMAIWKQVQDHMNEIFEEGEHCKHYYFPLFIPVRLLAKEATHVAGFAPECAIVTNHRLISDGKGGMVPDPEAALSEPLVVRPTSETIIGESFRNWIRSVKDLPLKLNQWANVVRWEGSRTTPFLRTVEFMWQEGHCVFATEEQARANALEMTRVYEAFMTQVCAMPVIAGEKSPGERFAGAEQTFCLEAMMQDGKAVQAGTSHYLGQNFAKSSEITFQDRDQEFKIPHTTSWGVSTRLIGAMIMTHSDDEGLCLPPRLAMHHVVILPAGKFESPERDQLIQEIKSLFKAQCFGLYEEPIRVSIDSRPGLNAAEKRWEWRRRGTPLIMEVGRFEVGNRRIPTYQRDLPHSEKILIELSSLVDTVKQDLADMQIAYYERARKFRDAHIRTDITTLDEIKAFFADKSNMGFVRAKWFVDSETEEMLKREFGVTIRCLPFDQTGEPGPCVLTGRETTTEAIFGRSY